MLAAFPEGSGGMVASTRRLQLRGQPRIMDTATSGFPFHPSFWEPDAAQNIVQQEAGSKMAAGGKVIFYIGGARSGKSRLAQTRAESMAGELIHIATAEAHDAEMAARIERHRADRGARWKSLEVPLDLPQALAQNNQPARVLLVDCLTLWVNNLLLAHRDLAAARQELVTTLAGMNATVILVSNEVGMGIVPANELARRFGDEAGWLHQGLAAMADEVWLVVAGLTLPLHKHKGKGTA